MNNIIEKIGTTKVKLTVEVDKDSWHEAQENAVKKLAKEVSLKGFRKGQAPLEMARKHLEMGKIWNEAIDSLLNPCLEGGIKQYDLHLAFAPSVSISKISDTDLTLVYDCILVPTCELGDYSKFDAKKEAPSVKDEEVMGEVQKTLEQNADLIPVEREAKLGDTVVMDFTGSLPDENGELKAFEGGSATNFSLELGSHQFVPGFEEAVVGVKAGEEKDIKVTFPTTYVKDLAGKEATFHLVIHEIKEKKIPELTDEAVKELGIKDVETVEALKNRTMTNLLTRKTNEAEEKFYNNILQELISRSTFSIDEEILNREAKRGEENLKKNIEAQGLTFEQYLEITGEKEDTIHNKMMEDAKHNYERFLVEQMVIQKEEIKVSEEELNAEIARMAKEYGIEEKRVREIVEQNKNSYIQNLLEKKVRTFLESKAA